MKKPLALFGTVIVAMAAPALAAPGDMRVSLFLDKAEKLQSRGMAAMFSSDLKLVMAEAKGAGAAYRARINADKTAGRVPHSCPPAKARVRSDEFMAHIRQIPAEQRDRISVTQATADFMARRYPCPGAAG